MDKIMSDSIEGRNTFNDITSGVGIFCGRPEITGRIGCLIISVVCVISSFFFVWNLFVTGPKGGDDILLSIIFILITVLTVFFTVFSFTYPTRPRKKVIFEGVWFSKDTVWLGEHEIELQKECSINDLINKECSINDLMNKGNTNPIHVNWKQTKRASCMDTSEISMVLQIVNTKHDHKDYRIEKVHIFKGKEDLCYDFVSTPTVLIINEVLYTCDMLTLIDQLKKIVENLEPIQKNSGICNLAITLRDSSNGDLTPIISSMGELNNAVQNEISTHRTMNTLEKGEFIDKENSDFLIKLMDEYGWKIVFY